MTPMQATVWRFNEVSRDGSVVLDNGNRLPFSSEVFAASRLRLLRPGQRVRLKVDDQGEIASMTIITLADPT